MPRVDVLVIGAGLAGLAAARELQRAGRSVLVLEQGPELGGRVATRRIGKAVLDHGAQFATTRSDRFIRLMDAWARQGAAVEWCRGFTDRQDGHPRWRGSPSMTAFPERLASGLKVRLGQPVTAVRLDPEGWRITTAWGEERLAGALVLTPPVPQSLALLEAGAVVLEEEPRSRLESIAYQRCIAVLAVLEGPSRIPPPGARPLEGEPLAWISDNHLKGISPIPALTLHAGPRFSREHWEQDREKTGRELLAEAGAWLGSPVLRFQVHGWRFSQPTVLHPQPCLEIPGRFPLVFAGDAFSGPKVEGAVQSGWAAAALLAD